MKDLASFGMTVFLFMHCCMIAMDVDQIFFKPLEAQCGKQEQKQPKMTLEDFLKHATEEYKKKLEQKKKPINAATKAKL